MDVGRAESPDSCDTASYGLGPGGFLRFFWIATQKSGRCFWLEMVEWDVHSTRERDIGIGVTDLAPFENQNQWLTQYILQWLAQFALVAYLTQALLARTDLPTYATLATHDSLIL